MKDPNKFATWFGQSKVVDQTGEPLVLYHGTDAKPFNLFRPSRFATYGDGIYFTDAIDQAKHYGDRVLAVFLSIQNPLVIKEGEFADVDAAVLEGYDGLMVLNEDRTTTYVVTCPEQIKSAVGNSGAFDVHNPDIFMSVPDLTDYEQVDTDAVIRRECMRG